MWGNRGVQLMVLLPVAELEAPCFGVAPTSRSTYSKACDTWK